MPERFSTSRIFHSTPTSTPGTTQALTTAARTNSVPPRAARRAERTKATAARSLPKKQANRRKKS